MVAFQDALGSQILKNIGWWFSATLAGWENTHPQWNFTCLQQIYHFLKNFLRWIRTVVWLFNASFGAPSIIQQLISLGLSGWREEHRKWLLLLTSHDVGQTPPRRSGWTGIGKFSRYISPLLSVKILSQGTCCLLRRRGKASKILLFLFFSCSSSITWVHYFCFSLLLSYSHTLLLPFIFVVSSIFFSFFCIPLIELSFIIIDIQGSQVECFTHLSQQTDSLTDIWNCF